MQSSAERDADQDLCDEKLTVQDEDEFFECLENVAALIDASKCNVRVSKNIKPSSVGKVSLSVFDKNTKTDHTNNKTEEEALEYSRGSEQVGKKSSVRGENGRRSGRGGRISESLQEISSSDGTDFVRNESSSSGAVPVPIFSPPERTSDIKRRRKSGRTSLTSSPRQTVESLYGKEQIIKSRGQESPRSSQLEWHLPIRTSITRRTAITAKPDIQISLWSILKNSIGKDLSKMPVPVNFSEPLSMLQRLTEDYVYSYVLDRAAQVGDSCERLAYIAAFTVSAYSETAYRLTKPFNPLLGETYECDRTDDLGWRSIAEQVSHHPPTLAVHCQGKAWKCWQEFTMYSKFRGKYLQVFPEGTAHLALQNGHHYSWKKVTTTVNNIIIGTLWVDNYGEVDVIDHTDGAICKLTYLPYSYFNRDSQYRVNGIVTDRNGTPKWVVDGAWNSKMEIAKIIEGRNPGKDDTNFETGPRVLVWERTPLPEGSEKFYNFTEFACQLNALEEGVAPTDCRLRPDQRLMEDGLWDEANEMKRRLETKQRAVRQRRETTGQVYAPTWFSKTTEPVTREMMHLYTDEYWPSKRLQDWAKCPDIYSTEPRRGSKGSTRTPRNSLDSA